jgi:hypothetical protein
MDFLLFDASDDGQGQGCWEAMASVRAERLPQLMAEIDAAVREAERDAPGPRGPLEEGGAWDAAAQVQAEGDWTTVTLSLTGPWDWGQALVARLTQA